MGHTRREGAVTGTGSMKIGQVGGAQSVNEEPRRGDTKSRTAAAGAGDVTRDTGSDVSRDHGSRSDVTRDTASDVW